MALNPWFVIMIWAVLILIMMGPLLTIPYLIVFPSRKENPFRDMPFESGQVPQGYARHRLAMQYYPFVLMFVVFDVVGMFLFAWGISFTKIPISSSLMVLLFLLLLGAPLGYALRLALRRENW